MALRYSPVWNTGSKGFNPNGLYAASFSKDGRKLACCDGQCVYILAATSATLSIRLHYPKASAGILWIQDFLVCAYEDGTMVNVRIKEAEEVVDIIFLHNVEHKIAHMAANETGDHLATGRCTDVHIWYWNVKEAEWSEGRNLVWPIYERDEAAVVITGMQWMGQERLIISYREHGVQLWDTKSCTMLRYILRPQDGLSGLSVSVEYRLLVVTKAARIEIYDLDTGALQTIAGEQYRDGLVCATFVHNGYSVVGLYQNGRIRAWNTELRAYEKVFTLQYPGSKNKALAVADYYYEEENRFVIAVVDTHSVTLWSTQAQRHEADMEYRNVVTPLNAMLVSLFVTVAAMAIYYYR